MSPEQAAVAILTAAHYEIDDADEQFIAELGHEDLTDLVRELGGKLLAAWYVAAEDLGEDPDTYTAGMLAEYGSHVAEAAS